MAQGQEVPRVELEGSGGRRVGVGLEGRLGGEGRGGWWSGGQGKSQIIGYMYVCTTDQPVVPMDTYIQHQHNSIYRHKHHLIQ